MTNRPDEAALEKSLASPDFQSGVALGRWAHVSTEWPFCFLSVRAQDGLAFAFRCECTGFPGVPSVEPWDLERGTNLAAEHRPKGAGNVAKVFRMDWEGGRHIYHPHDRVAASGHSTWGTELPQLTWRPERGIVQLVAALSRLLNGGEYGPDVA